MKRVVSFAVAIAMLFSGVVLAEDIKSGLKKDAMVGPFYVTKVCGAEKDGVAVGRNLCYRCKNGGRPQVMVFTRSTDETVTKLVKKLDECVKKNEESQLRAFVNVLGDSKDSASDESTKLAKASKAEQIPFVVPNEYENGPEDYGINPKAELTIIFANGGKVVANHAVASVKDLDVAKVIGTVEKALN